MSYEIVCETCGNRLEDCECVNAFPNIAFDPNMVYGNDYHERFETVMRQTNRFAAAMESFADALMEFDIFQYLEYNKRIH